MGRRSKTLKDYNHPDIERVSEEFDKVTSQEKVKYVCSCKREVESKKRLIAARLISGKPLLCDSCKNRINRLGKTKDVRKTR